MEMIRDYNEAQFERTALEVFRKQYDQVPVYGEFVRALGVKVDLVHRIADIPFLPAGFFRSHEVIAREKVPEIIFESSGTTGMEKSRHLLASTALYRESFTKGFEYFYGNPADWCILALLPSYLERENSSLVYMARHLIELSGGTGSGFYLHDHHRLMESLRNFRAAGQKTLLLGVSFALTDLAEEYKEDLSDIVIMETGGMKGRKKEMVREEVHSLITERFGVPSVHSEYGMTELLSQAYSKGSGIFRTPPWMKVLIRESHDPFSILPPGSSGLISIIDFANVYSCSFIATSDLGRSHSDGSFEVLGRMDNADIRGCNLLIA